MTAVNPPVKYANHPAADLFPMMSEPELKKLADDIKANGLRDAISLHEDMILDGRNRLAACELAGIAPTFEIVTTDSPCGFVISKNLHRRQLTVSQKAMVAAKLMPMLRAEAKERQSAGGGDHKSANQKSVGVKLPQPISAPPGGRSKDVAGSLVGVSGAIVQRAVSILETKPEVAAKVERGELTVNAAYCGKESQSQPAKEDHVKEKLANFGDKRREMLENAAKRRMMDGVAQIGGLCNGLSGIDIELLKKACDANEIKTWARTLRRLCSQLREFASKLSRSEVNEEAENADA